MDKTWQPQQHEKKWYDTWERNGWFAPAGDGPAYCIMIPPPNVTGSLHMGHAFQDTLMDLLVRYHRMRGDRTLWQVGTDHAGIATQMVVERKLAAEGSSRLELGREKFLEKVWEWKHESGNTITRQLRRMGASVDWSRERFTMDDGLSNAVREVFVRLHEEGLVYRGKRLVNWDPKLHTAISDLEVVSEEEKGSLWHFRYPLSSGEGHLVVATTRPETMLGDTAVAVHPEDERYRHLVGQTVDLPLTGRTIPVIADEYVDPEFGTGCVKITPAHDFNDYEVGQRHDLPMINVFTPDAALNDNAPEAYRGLDRYAAREQVLADLESQGLLEKVEDHVLKVPRGDRSGVVVEPYLTDQWFVRVAPLAEPAIRAVENGDIEFVPKNWENTYFAWMRDIQDWCISRQLWWGHRIPAWYDEAGNVYVGRDEDEVREKHGLDAGVGLRQDEDVLDTWFSSALWTFSTLGWPDKTPELETFHPTSVLVTGFDIIFFWIARMIMMTLRFMDQVPFHKVYVHGLVRDAEGEKMSKSKGNILDPIDLIDGIGAEELVSKRTGNLMQPQLAKKIEKATRKHFPEGIAAYGTDALRFTFCSLASTGRDIKFDIGRIEGYRNFCNKLWNASRYVLMNVADTDTPAPAGDAEPGLADRWIVARLQDATARITEGVETYRFDLASQALYDFVWNEYCDWYLELTKPVLWDDSASPAAKAAVRRTLVEVLESILRLAHPFMPFITEEIWQQVRDHAGRNGETIMHQPYPIADPELVDAAAVGDIEWVKSVVVAIRNIRGEMDIAPGRAIPVLFRNGDATDQRRLAENRRYLEVLAKLESAQWLEHTDTAPVSATQIVGAMEVLVPMAGLIDRDAELARLDKGLGRIAADMQRVEGKLGNDKFVANAPAEVIARERDKLADLQSRRARLEEQKSRIEKLET